MGMYEVEVPGGRCRSSQGLLKVQEEAHGDEAEREVGAGKQHGQRSSRATRHPLVR